MSDHRNRTEPRCSSLKCGLQVSTGHTHGGASRVAGAVPATVSSDPRVRGRRRLRGSRLGNERKLDGLHGPCVSVAWRRRIQGPFDEVPARRRRERACKRFAESQIPLAKRGGRGFARDFVYGTRRFGRREADPPLNGNRLPAFGSRGQGRGGLACASRSDPDPPSWPFGSGVRADGALGSTNEASEA